MPGLHGDEATRCVGVFASTPQSHASAPRPSRPTSPSPRTHRSRGTHDIGSGYGEQHVKRLLLDNHLDEAEDAIVEGIGALDAQLAARAEAKAYGIWQELYGSSALAPRAPSPRRSALPAQTRTSKLRMCAATLASKSLEELPSSPQPLRRAQSFDQGLSQAASKTPLAGAKRILLVKPGTPPMRAHVRLADLANAAKDESPAETPTRFVRVSLSDIVPGFDVGSLESAAPPASLHEFGSLRSQGRSGEEQSTDALAYGTPSKPAHELPSPRREGPPASQDDRLEAALALAARPRRAATASDDESETIASDSDGDSEILAAAAATATTAPREGSPPASQADRLEAALALAARTKPTRRQPWYVRMCGCVAHQPDSRPLGAHGM